MSKAQAAPSYSRLLKSAEANAPIQKSTNMKTTPNSLRIAALPLATFLFTALSLTGCKQPPAESANSATSGTSESNSMVGKAAPYARKDAIWIGEYGDLTGATAAFGTSTRDGIALAVDEANKAGGVLGKQIHIQLENNNGKPDETTTVVKKLIG